MAHQALTPEMTDAEFDRHVMGILARELGAGGFARYLMLHRSGPGDYTAERHQWQAGLTISDILRDLDAEKR
jgi:hypothetical protein